VTEIRNARRGLPAHGAAKGSSGVKGALVFGGTFVSIGFLELADAPTEAVEPFRGNEENVDRPMEVMKGLRSAR